MQKTASGKNLLLVTLGSMAAAGVLAALWLALAKQPLWWQGYHAALTIAGIILVVSVPPLMIGLRYGGMAMVVVCLASFLLRTLVCLAAVVVAIIALRYPPLPTIILAAVFYLTLLGTETAYLGMTRWSA